MASNGIVTYSQLGNNGRTGNQMFQVALSIAYALDTGRDYIFPYCRFNKFMEKQLPTGWMPNIDKSIAVSFNYAPIPNPPDKNINLTGYGQTSKYFSHKWESIKPYFTLKKEYKDYIFEKYNKILLRNTCSVHVRRTDYTCGDTLKYHGLISMEYYTQAIINEIYGSEKENVLFVIFSDDIKWCKEKFDLPTVTFIEDENDVLEIFLMAQCKNNIIANSSFSWWGAFLSENKNKKVIAPKNWFTPECPENSRDVAEKEWVLI